MSELRLESVTATRGRVRALQDVSVRFGGGGLAIAIGPNGAGKSTLLRVLAGLSKPAEGRALFDGAPLDRMDARALAKRRAYLPQNPVCEWPISVENLVALGLMSSLPTFGAFSPAHSALVQKALEGCDLMTLRERRATELSGGELARAMLARALVGNPEILIVDEPTAGLDPKHALEAMRLMRRTADAGTAVIAAMHDLTLAARFADRVLLVRDGRLLADGTPRDVLTPTLLQAAFDVEAEVHLGDGAAHISFTPRDL